MAQTDSRAEVAGVTFDRHSDNSIPAKRTRGDARFSQRVFAQLDMDFCALCPREYRLEAEREVADLRARNAADPSWQTNHRMEQLIVVGLPRPLLRQRIRQLQAQLEAVTGRKHAQAVLQAAGAGADQDENSERAAALVMLTEIQQARTAESEFGRVHNRVEFLLLSVGAVLALLIGVALYLSGTHAVPVPPATYAVFGGVLGGYFSVLLRVGRLHWHHDRTANHENISRIFWDTIPALLLAMLEGGVAALVLHTLFLSGALEGSLFPQYQHSQDFESWNLLPQWLWLGPTDSYGVNKLIAWSLVAGFSERLVPDLLSKLSKSADFALRSEKGQRSPSPKAAGTDETQHVR